MVGLVPLYEAFVKVLDLGLALLVRQERREVHHICSISAINGQIRELFLHLLSESTFDLLSSLRFSRVFSHLAFNDLSFHLPL
jgi:hypothetical protein